MNDPTANTAQLHRWIERFQAGDLDAQEELLRGFADRLERLARKMLGRFPNVHRWADTGDVLQNSLLRLLRGLRTLRPASTREFFALAAEQMRRELLDLYRHYYGPQGVGANHASHPGGDGLEPAVDAAPDRATEEEDDLEKWGAFHEAVERLPVEEREVVGLVFYHGWTQPQVGELLQISERTVRRRWESALVKLHGALRQGD